ncbi:MAG: hypothetical protein ACXQS2_01810, partial [Methermicoccaceae archaeon]
MMCCQKPMPSHTFGVSLPPPWPIHQPISMMAAANPYLISSPPFGWWGRPNIYEVAYAPLGDRVGGCTVGSLRPMSP